MTAAPKVARRRRAPSPAQVARIMHTLAREIGGMQRPAMEKISGEHAEDPFRILVGTLLSARTQDATTHEASNRLFRVAGNAKAMAALSVTEIESLIYPVGFYRNKARFVKGTSQALVDRFGGKVPETLEELVTLPGVGRKTANLVLILGFRSQQNICVDTHVHRISNRFGWVRTADPEQTERALYQAIEARWWPYLNQYLVTWGQNVCRPIHPRCDGCAVANDCPRLGVRRSARS
jgi:endonuclease III